MKTQTRELLQYCKLLALLLLAGVITTEETKAQSVQIGSGTQVSSPVTASPVNIYYRSLRCQFVYTAAELTASGASAGYLDSLGFYIDNAPVYGLPNYSIKMRATSFADVSMHDSGTLYEVYHHPLYQPMAGGFEMLKLDSLFFWNGSDNLLLDICFDQVNPNWSVTGKVRVFTANNGFRYIRSNSGSQCGNVTTSILNSKPQAILSFIPNLALNAGVSSIDSLDQVCEGSTQTAYARIRNWGTSSLTSVKVGWSLNGVLQSTNTFAVNLDGITGSGTKDTLVSLGPISFNLGQSYTIQAWTEMPNGGVDGFPQNDSLTKVVSPSLLGTYTIGGINPDFATFAAAVNQLNEAGICDSVRFLVRPGTYNEQLVLSAISGTDSLHQVVFTAENGDSSSVVLSFASSLASQNYTVLLDESQYVRFDRLTLQGNGPNYGRVVEFRNGASQNEFRHCAILGSSVSTDSTDHALIYTDLNEGSYLENQFVGNRLQHGSYGLYWYDVYQSEDLTIADNQFFDQYAGGIYLQSISELTISGNQIQSTSSDSAFQGIYLVSVDQPEILNNQISLTNGGHGIYLSNTYGTFGDSGLVANNFVSISGTNPAYGIHYHSGSELKFVFNNVNLGAATDSSSRSFYFHPYDESSTVRNNNLVNWGSGFALYVKQDLFLVSDYNNLFSPNGRVGYYDGTTLTTLADWQLITGFDAHSLSVNPLYVSLQDLHVQKGLLNAAGVADISVPHDIDGELRSNPPDLGADEFTATQTDVIAVQILHPPTPFPAGSIPLSLVIQNGGGTSLSSLTVDWKVNGSLQSSLNWSGSLATGQKDTLLLGNWNFTGGTPFDIMAWTSSPNGGSDFDTSDDTTSVDYLIAGLSGSYTIGGSNPDFADFTAATNALNTGGILDSVTFLVRPGTYNEQLLIHEFPGNSCTRPVVFQAENGDSSSVILTFNANSNANYTVFLNGADGIQFRKLTLEASNGTYSRVLHLDNGVKCHVLSHSVLQGSAGPFSSNERTLVYSTGAGAADSSIQILQNRLVGGSYSVFLNGTSDDLGTHISNNQLENLGGYGIFLQYQNAPLVQFNQINSDSANAKGIYLGDCSGALRIEGNRISFPDGGYGIFLQDCYGASGDSGLIANNFIYLGGPDYADGMYLKDYSHLRVRHNNVHITSTDVSGGRALYLSGYHADDVFQNNNFVNTGGGKALVFNTSYYGLHDYNNLYSTGSSLVDADGVSYADLSTWQSSSGLEQHSISINPLYASVSDLHVNKPLLNGAGVYVPDPLDDIDGELRNNPPDIGADEFSVTGMDVMATYLEGPSVPFAAGSYPLSFGFRNVGTDTLNSLLVNWQVNGALQASVNWTGTLAPGGSDTVLLGSLTLNNGNIYLLESWTSLPNGLPDVDPTDDTLSVGLSPALAGTYTIGGSTPDYSSLNEASYALGLAGIADTVVFNIRNGTYQEQLVIGSFPGMDCSLPVIFQSETQDSAAVRIRYQGSANANYVLHLRGVQGLVFRYLTLEALDANYSRVVVFEEGPDCNLFEGNHIFGPSTTATTSGQALVDYDGDALCVNNHFVGNHFENASMGIRWYNTGPLDSGLVVQDNLFEEQYYMGVFAARQFAPQFQGNTVRTLNGDADFYGFYLEECEAGMHISGNQIDMPGGGIGVYLPFSNGTTADPNLIANNFIHVGGSATDYGISLNYSPHTRIAHNSVHITSTDSLSGIGIVRGANSSGVSLFNNNLVNSGGGLALRIVDTESFQSDHNNFYTTGPQLAYRDMQHADLAAWQSYTAEDGNSLSTDPLFVSPSDLHVSNAALDGAGTPISDISFDIDGNTRDPYAPDIGADEFATATADAGLFGLLSPAPLFAEGDHPVKVVLFNNATLPLASVTVHWAVDTFVQTPVAWTGNLAPGDSAQLTLGNFTFNIGQPYTLKAWLSDPNGVPDQQTQNDTLLVDSLYASLAGYYTIGGANPNFNSFNEAVNVAMLSGVVDSVIFNVRSDTFWEQVIIPAIPGASAQNRIVFQAESGDSTDAVLAYAASSFNPQYTVLLDGADFIEFRHLTLLATGTTYGRPLELKNEAQNLRVSHCELIGTGTSSSTALVYGNSYQYHHLSFTHNLFRGGKEGIYLRGYSSSLLSSGILIENNIFEDQTGSSVYLRYMDAPVVRANEFQSAVLDNYGIYCYFCDHEMLIADNQLQLPDASRVIYLYRCDGQINQRGLVANNFIYNNRANGGEGLYVYYATYLDVVFNSVHLQGSSSGKAISMFGGSQLRLQNNIFTHTGGGYSLYSNSGSNIALADYNDYFTTGSNLAYWNTNVSDLATLQALNGMDAHSLSLDPLFESDTNLHVREVGLNGAGIPIPGVDRDIDGELRDPQNPDIGADEFVPVIANDAGVVAVAWPQKPFPAGSNPVQVVIRNFGLDTLTSLAIDWKLNTVAQPVVNWIGFLATGETDTLDLGTVNFSVGNAYAISAWSFAPNGLADTLNYNDTAQVMNLYPALDGVYTIGGFAPNFANFQPAADALINGGIVGPVTFNVRNGTYTEYLSFPSIAGSGHTQPIVFQAESGDSTDVVLTTDSMNHVLQLNGADYFTFQNLTLQRSGGIWANRRVIVLTGGADHNTFQNNLIRNQLSTTSSITYEVVHQSANNFQELNHGNVFRNNRIEGGGYGLFLKGYSTSYPSSGIELDNNQISGQYYQGVHLEHMLDAKIRHNVLRYQGNDSFYEGLHVEDGLGQTEIVGNTIYALSGKRALYLNGLEGDPGQSALIANNFLQIGGGGGNYALALHYSQSVDVFHNSILNTSPDSTNSAAVLFYGGSDIDLRNNILANTAGGLAISIPSVVSFTHCDYNDYYSSGSHLGNWLGNSINDLAQWQASVGLDVHSLSVDPLFYADTNLHVSQVALDSAAQPIAAVGQDIDLEARDAQYPDIGGDEFSYLPNDLGISQLVNPGVGCDLSFAEVITVQIQNYGGSSQTGFDVGYRINNGPVVVENVGSLTVAPGNSTSYAFATPANLSGYGNYSLELFTLLPGDQQSSNDTLAGVIIVNQPAVTSPVGNMLPIDGVLDLVAPVNFSWSPPLGADHYDIYIWPDTGSAPLLPTGANLNQISYQYGSLYYGQTYQWKVVAKNVCSSLEGPTQSFTMGSLADIVVDSVKPPPIAFSGQGFTMQWTVRNIGSGGTQSVQWNDAVFLSLDQVYDASDQYLGALPNLSSLMVGESYVQTANFTLPQGIYGTYYLLVLADYYSQLLESDYNNNRSYAGLQISLTDPPDLQVQSVLVSPPNAFSGTTVNISWTVQNVGDGGTVSSFWRDYVFISTDPSFAAGTPIFLGEKSRTSSLASDSLYAADLDITLPQGIFGTYYLHVVTDVADHVYEYLSEGNNSATSDSVQVFLTPPTDLVVSSFSVPPSGSNKEQITVQWTVQNQGGSPTNNPYWYDHLFLSPAPDSNLTAATEMAGVYHAGVLNPGDSYTQSQAITLPDSINGPYYLYLFTDYDDEVYEYLFEDNNLALSDTLVVRTQDLVVSSVSGPATANSGQGITLKWTVENIGDGDLAFANWTDQLYLSPTPGFDLNTALPLGELNYTSMLAAGDSFQRQKTVALPSGIAGNHYLAAWTDEANAIYEAGQDTNNLGVATSPIQIALAPWPDLQVVGIQLTDSAQAGDILDVGFSIQNLGLGSALGSGWEDQLYLSTDSFWNPVNAQPLQAISRSQPLAADSTYEVSTQCWLPIPGSGTGANYTYLYVFADDKDDIFEYTDENNNVLRSDPLLVTVPPPVDLRVLEATSDLDSVVAGQTADIEWSVENLGSSTETWNFLLWYDGVFLSADSTFDAGDLLATDWVVADPVEMGANYQRAGTFTFPQGLSGTFFLFLVADHGDFLQDADRSNNALLVKDLLGNPLQVHVTVPPYPDLVPTQLVNAPTAQAGQAMKILWKVENQGVGPTTHGTWTDHFFLSTDFVLDGGDMQIGSRVRAGDLNPGQYYLDSLVVNIPIGVAGNFFVLVKTDAYNVEFEHLGEGNNVINSYVTITAPPPSDLIVSAISVPDSVQAGGLATISWTLANVGANPATGQMNEAVYFSLDTIWDMGDVLFGVNTTPVNLAPLTTDNRSLVSELHGLYLDEYYVIVRTDILNNILESNEANNSAYSEEQLKIKVPDLPLGVWTPDSLNDGERLFYRIVVDDTLTGETLLVEMKGDSVAGNNQLYLSFEAVPSQVEHDFSSIIPLSGIQTVVIPSLKQGTYYLMATGSTSNGDTQAVQLRPYILPFAIRYADAAEGGNTGSVTTLLAGSKFEDPMILYLEDSVGGRLYATTQYYVDPIVTYGTFGLAGAKVGTYDIVAVNLAGDTARLEDGFRIVSGDVSETSSGFSCTIENIGYDQLMGTDYSYPLTTRRNRLVPITIHYANLGNVDIPVPVRYVVSLRGSPLSFSVGGLISNRQNLQLKFQETGGPPHVLRPGAGGSITIYTQATSPIHLRVFK